MKTTTAALLVALAAPAVAQDSVSKTNALPGDAVSPWDDSSATFGSEQTNSYVVDLTPLTTSWGTEFALGPVAKTSKVNSGFFSALISAQGISRLHRQNVPLSGTYGLWTAPGGGVNNDPAINDAGTPVTPTGDGNQFGVVFAEFGTTDAALDTDFSGIVSSIVQYDPVDPTRLYVERILAAQNGCSPDGEYSALGAGSVDSAGNVVFRADGSGIDGLNCAGLTSLSDNNVYLVDAQARDTSSLNVVSIDYPGGLFDAAATKWLIQVDADVHNTPGIAEVAGVPTYIGTNFATEFVVGADFGAIATTNFHLGGTLTDHRGNVSHLEQNFALLSSTEGVCAALGKVGGLTNGIAVWGLGFGGFPSGAIGLVLPTSVTDNDDGFVSLAGLKELDHYHSQVAFQGGNGQVALNLDPAGDLLVSAVVDQPFDGGGTWGIHFIAVIRVDSSGNETWTMAGYQDFAGGGKAIKDGPGGAVIGQMSELGLVTGGLQLGPSVSAPMIDSGGNVWFTSAIEVFDDGGGASEFTIGLLRAVYDRASFSYELELVLKEGDVFRGPNSDRDYRIGDLFLADDNSISSSAAWSQNVSERGHTGQLHNGVGSSDPLKLGGLVLGASIDYDYDDDGLFADDEDQSYSVALYLGADASCQLDLGSQGPGETILTVCGDGLGAIGDQNVIRLTGAPPSVPTFFLMSLPGLPDAPFGGGTLVSAAGLIGGFPIGFATDANGELAVPLGGLPFPLSFVFQMVTVDLSQPQLFSISNALLARFGV